MTVKKHSIRFLQRRQRAFRISQRDLKAIVAEIYKKNGRIVSQRVSFRRRRKCLEVVTHITCSGGTLVQVRPPLFVPNPE